MAETVLPETETTVEAIAGVAGLNSATDSVSCTGRAAEEAD